MNKLKSKIDFEDYLKDIHAKNYIGTDDDMPDAFNTWLTELQVDDIIKYANQVLIDLKKKINLNMIKNKELYLALKSVIRMAYESGIHNGEEDLKKDIKKVEDWLEEIKKNKNNYDN